MAFTLPQMIPDGTYRIRSAQNPPRYFQYEDGNSDVAPKVLEKLLDKQKWEIKGDTSPDGYNSYTITNVASRTQLAFRDLTDKDGNKVRQLTTAQAGNKWTIEPRGRTFVLGMQDNQQCIDLSGSATRLLLWERNNLDNQRWVLETIYYNQTKPESDKIKIVNLSSTIIQVSATTFTNSTDTRNWTDTNPDTFTWWKRSGEEVVTVRVTNGIEPAVLTTGVITGPGTVIEFYGLGHPGIVVTK